MSAKQVTLVLRGPHSQIVIDGNDVIGSVAALTLYADRSGAASLLLTLRVSDLLVNGEFPVSLADDTAAALIELGWTPPGAEEVAS